MAKENKIKVSRDAVGRFYYLPEFKYGLQVYSKEYGGSIHFAFPSASGVNIDSLSVRITRQDAANILKKFR